MGIVVDVVVERFRETHGRRYHWFEWEACAAQLGLRATEMDGLTAPAYLYGNWIIIRAGMSQREKAWHAWEEIGHHLTVAGNRETWRTSLPGMQGELNVARFERLADGVRRELPDWGGALPF